MVGYDRFLAVELPEEVHGVSIAEMEDVVFNQRVQEKDQVIDTVAVVSIKKPEILAVIVDLARLVGVDIQDVRFPAFFAKRTRDIPGVVIALADVKNGTFFLDFHH